MNARRQPSFAKAIRALSHRPRGETGASSRPTLAVFVAYSDIASARTALNRLTALLRQTRGAEVRPMCWRFDQLEDPRWREMALRDAQRAAVVTLAMPDEAAFCPRTQAWITALLERSQGGSLTVWAVVGDNEPLTISLAQPSRRPASAPPVVAAATEVFASVAPKRIAACAA